jgi:hypothetical protein
MKHIGRPWRALALAAMGLLVACGRYPCGAYACGPNSPWRLYTSARPDNVIALYAPPFAVPADHAATIRGSDGFGYRSFVWAVDGKPVLDAAARWSEPVVVSADEIHRLSLGYDAGDISGTIQIDFTGGRGSALIVETDNVVHKDGITMWLADAASHESASEKFMVHLGSGSKPAPQQTLIITVRVRRR